MENTEQATRLKDTEERLRRREEQLQQQRSKVTAQERTIAMERRRRHDLVVQLNLLSDELHDMTQQPADSSVGVPNNGSNNGYDGSGGSGGLIDERYTSPMRKPRQRTPASTPSPSKQSPTLQRVRAQHVPGPRGATGAAAGEFTTPITEWSPARVAAVGSLERARQVRTRGRG